jgi:hypothetical protein
MNYLEANARLRARRFGRRRSFPPPTFGERRHRSLARRLVAMRRCAVLVVPEGQCPHPGRAYGRRVGFEDAADNYAIGKHVKIIIVPLTRGTAR